MNDLPRTPMTVLASIPEVARGSDAASLAPHPLVQQHPEPPPARALSRADSPGGPLEIVKMPQTHLAAVAVEKSYSKCQHKIPVLRGVEIQVRRGDFVSIVGQSGSGKSTLLHLMGLLDVPDVGEITLYGHRVDDLPARARDELRNRVFGFIFQFYHLLPELNVMENVLAPLMIRHSAWQFWKQRKALQEQARLLIEKVGLGHRLTHKPAELSGGEMQRAAIARALMGNPEVLLADEPTGNLDAQTGREIMDLLASLNGQNDLTIIMVTHDQSIAQRAHRVVRLAEGRLDAWGAAA
jgi:lipoprotein-releasing system ATP-binding protein